MTSSEQYGKKAFLTKIISYSLIAILIQLILGYFVFRYIAMKNDEQDIRSISARVENGLQFKNSKWDTTLYTSDPQTPHPSGSSGYSTPLYIITADGFVIERNTPITGLLDTSDFNHLMLFQKPQNISVVTNETWRIYSQPITYNNKNVGVIMTAFYSPDDSIIEKVDERLSRTLNTIKSKVVYKNGKLDVSKVDLRHIDYDISFEVVNSFNKVLLNNGRMPTYVDKSYVENELKHTNSSRIIKNGNTSYLVYSKELLDNHKNIIGLVAVGKSINYIDQIFTKYALFIIGITLLIALLLLSLIKKALDRFTASLLRSYEETQSQKPLPSDIRFNKEESYLEVDGQNIEIPFASNQYYLCEAIFSHPHKRWEQDELLDKFGEIEPEHHWRKVYDAAHAINKKLGVKLIESKDRTFRVNPDFLPLIKSTSKR